MPFIGNMDRGCIHKTNPFTGLLSGEEDVYWPSSHRCTICYKIGDQYKTRTDTNNVKVKQRSPLTESMQKMYIRRLEQLVGIKLIFMKADYPFISIRFQQSQILRYSASWNTSASQASYVYTYCFALWMLIPTKKHVLGAIRAPVPSPRWADYCIWCKPSLNHQVAAALHDLLHLN